MNFPTNVKYTSEHEWIRLENDEAIIGITDYAQDQLGDIQSTCCQSAFLDNGGLYSLLLHSTL